MEGEGGRRGEGGAQTGEGLRMGQVRYERGKWVGEDVTERQRRVRDSGWERSGEGGDVSERHRQVRG